MTWDTCVQVFTLDLIALLGQQQLLSSKKEKNRFRTKIRWFFVKFGLGSQKKSRIGFPLLNTNRACILDWLICDASERERQSESTTFSDTGFMFLFFLSNFTSNPKWTYRHHQDRFYNQHCKHKAKSSQVQQPAARKTRPPRQQVQIAKNWVIPVHHVPKVIQNSFIYNHQYNQCISESQHLQIKRKYLTCPNSQVVRMRACVCVCVWNILYYPLPSFVFKSHAVTNEKKNLVYSQIELIESLLETTKCSNRCLIVRIVNYLYKNDRLISLVQRDRLW